jgi:hypothetical protein
MESLEWGTWRHALPVLWVRMRTHSSQHRQHVCRRCKPLGWLHVDGETLETLRCWTRSQPVAAKQPFLAVDR